VTVILVDDNAERIERVDAPPLRELLA